MFFAVERLIGNTPLIALNLTYQGQSCRIYAKLEYFNLSGSIKDRMALEVLRAAYQSGALRRGDMIVEATSGNAGIAFSALGRALGHPVRIYMPDWMSRERIALLQSYGAEVCLISHEEGGFLGSIKMAEELARRRNDVFLPRQFSNPDNCNAHCKSTGPEILHQLGCVPDAFVAGVGTGGTVMGVGRALRACDSKVGIHPMEPAESPTLSTGYKVGKHRIQGVSDDFIPDIVCLKTLDGVVGVNDGDGIIMAQKLSADLGLAVGISSGANLVAALKLARDMDPDAKIVTVFCDDNKKYLSTDLTQVEPVKPGYLSADVELLNYTVC
ncbi:MAG: PLP-dependent cysteine synthase family protein [Hyphomonadaceae bacterium]|nr:PLP-dependent cysteine synthase family protein [Hyphomonadaceae bacterium]MBC6413069.1 PLP-dependent cysteine synthase family protein [Hyphomonadaceae bacterium]